jgi:hypothetical protein
MEKTTKQLQLALNANDWPAVEIAANSLRAAGIELRICIAYKSEMLDD